MGQDSPAQRAVLPSQTGLRSKHIAAIVSHVLTFPILRRRAVFSGMLRCMYSLQDMPGARLPVWQARRTYSAMAQRAEDSCVVIRRGGSPSGVAGSRDRLEGCVPIGGNLADRQCKTSPSVRLAELNRCHRQLIPNGFNSLGDDKMKRSVFVLVGILLLFVVAGLWAFTSAEAENPTTATPPCACCGPDCTCVDCPCDESGCQCAEAGECLCCPACDCGAAESCSKKACCAHKK